MFILSFVFAARMKMHSGAVDTQRQELERRQREGSIPQYGQPIEIVETLPDGTVVTKKSQTVVTHHNKEQQ